jgi:hypothetical protein
MVLKKIEKAELFCRRLDDGLAVVINDGHF